MKKAQSIKKIKNKLRKRTVLTVCISIFCCLLICIILIFFMKNTIVDTLGLKREITDINKYEECFGENLRSVYFEKLGVEDSIFPEEITSDMGVEEFKFVFENIADPQYLAYLTVEYTDEKYVDEVQRLEEKGTNEFVGYYGVEGEPEGYKVLAMVTDSTYGFVYAITPTEKSNYITYVEIIFCNYFLDLDIKKYIPESYILDGFDASVNNSYRKLKMNIL